MIVDIQKNLPEVEQAGNNNNNSNNKGTCNVPSSPNFTKHKSNNPNNLPVPHEMIEELKRRVPAFEIALMHGDKLTKEGNGYRGSSFWRNGDNPRTVLYDNNLFHDYRDTKGGNCIQLEELASNCDFLTAYTNICNRFGHLDLLPKSKPTAPRKEALRLPPARVTTLPSGVVPTLIATPPTVTGEVNEMERFEGLPVIENPNADIITIHGAEYLKSSRQDYPYLDKDGFVVLVLSKYYNLDETDKTFIRHYAKLPTKDVPPVTFDKEHWDTKAPDNFVQPIYNLLDVLNNPNAIVFATEGESDAEALRELGFIVTCHKSSGNMDYEPLKDRTVILIGDNEESGTGEQLIGKSLEKMTMAGANVIEVAYPPREDGTKKEDVRSWLGRQTGTSEDIISKLHEWIKTPFTGRGLEDGERLKSQTLITDSEPAKAKCPIEIFTLEDIARDFDVTQPDPNEIITTRFFCKGQPFLLVAPTSCGKSSFLMQWLFSLAIGKPFMGLNPVQGNTFSSLIIQAENDQRDLAQMIDGTTKLFNVSFPDVLPEAIQLASRNVRVITMADQTGDCFCDKLTAMLKTMKAMDELPDIIAIDPLLSFAGFDLTNQEKCSQFTRLRLQAIITDFNVGLIITHHTGKVTNNAKEKLADEYNFFGTSDLVNWIRSSLLIEPYQTTDSDGRRCFKLKALKHGSLLNWENNTKYMRFAESGIIGFEERTANQMPQYKTDSANVGSSQRVADLLKLIDKEEYLSFTAFTDRVVEKLDIRREDAIKLINTAAYENKGQVIIIDAIPEIIKTYNLHKQTKKVVHLLFPQTEKQNTN